MEIKHLSRKLAAYVAAITCVSATMTAYVPSTPVVQAAQSEWHFDFGGGGAANGYTAADAGTDYSKSTGYGFANTSQVKNVGAAGSGALSDAVQFNSTDKSNTFNVDLPNGLYEIKVTLGNTTRTSVRAENMLQIINMTGNNAVDSFTIPVTDGQLNIMATEGRAGSAFTLSALDITKLSDSTETKPTIWVCGDSTVCNYYPLATSTQAGWAQMLGNYVDTDKFMIRNMAASGQYAKGFVDAGQFDAIEAYGKKGDYYIISIGINDTNYSNATEYYNTVSDMTKRAKAKGMTVILVKQQGRNGDAARNLTSRWFAGELDQIGKEQDCQVVDLFNLFQDYCRSIGTDATTALYMDGDTLHPNRAGADKLAELVASQIDFVAINATEPTTEPQTEPQSIRGDVNADGQFNVSDVVLLQKWLLAVPNTHLADWKAADLCEDDKLDGFDLCMMRRELVSAGNRYLAVNAAVNNGVSENTNAGSSTGNYVNLNNEIGSSITWTVNVSEDGNYKLIFRNANGGTADRDMKLSLSGTSDTWTVSFPTTGGWTNWADSTIVVPMTNGIQTVTLTSLTADGGPNLDYLTLEKVSSNAQQPTVETVTPVQNKSGKQVEALTRGLVAANTGNGMLVSWRYLATDGTNATYKLYKNGTLLKEFGVNDATNYLDNGGKAADTYTVETYINGAKTDTASVEKVLANKNSGQSGAYFDIPLDVPAAMTMPDGSTCTYSPNDASVGDVDGDGEYEIILKWDPSNSKDNSQDGYTGNVLIDCYKLNGTKLWRVDLGVNIRAGAHYTQFMVYDYDGDGKAEMVCKTSDGTVDGTGKTIGNANADYRSNVGRILTGNEYLTLFDGQTGAALDTVDYKPGRGTVANWGDGYGNRVDRFLAATAYLDGQTPSVLMVRGYYTRMAVTAYDVVNKKLVERWAFDTGHNTSAAGYGDGNHNCMPADVDGDGKQELVMGSAVIDDDGTLLYTSGLKHGDALHVGDFDPSNAGVEIFMCHEEANAGYGISLRDGKTGNMLFREKGDGDTGRCLADNLIAGNNSAEIVGAHNGNVYDTSGNKICNWSDVTKWGQNFVIYWSDTLERCVLDRGCIDQYGKGRVMTADGGASINGTKSVPSLSCDLFGDWREEVIFPANDGSVLRVYTTTYQTEYKIYTLMHNAQYRAQVAGQNVAYNQPPHTDYFIGTGFALPDLPEVYTAG